MKFLRLAGHFASVVTLIALLDSCALAQSQKQPIRQPEGAQGQPAGDLRGTTQARLIVQVQPTPKSDEDAAQIAERQERAEDRRFTRRLGWFTLLIGVLQAGIIAYQLRISSQQNAIIRTQDTIMEGQRTAANLQFTYMEQGLAETKRTAEAARDAAAAAIKANELTESEHQNNHPIVKRANRAYVSLFIPEPADLLAHFVTDRRVGYMREISVVFQNTGNSDALDFRYA